MLLKDTAQTASDCLNAVKKLNSTCQSPSESTLSRKPAVAQKSTAAPSRAVSLKDIPDVSFEDADQKTQVASSLTPEQMKEAFAILKAAKEMRWDIPDLCAQKAQKGSILLQNAGVNVGKVFATTPKTLKGALTDSDRLRPKLTGKNGETVKWDYHVAPFVLLKDGGKESKWVLDPLLFSEPVPLEVWKKSVDAQSSRVELRFANRFVFTPVNIYSNPQSYNPEETKAATKDLMNAEQRLRGLEGR